MTKKAKEQVERIARLARLHLSEKEKEVLGPQFEKLLEHFRSIQALPTDQIEPMVHPLTPKNVLRPDEVQHPEQARQILENAPQRAGEFFRVPKVIEG